MKDDTSSDEAEVTIDRVIFRDESTGFTVVRARGGPPAFPGTATGTFLSEPRPGDRYRLRGRTVEHPRFGLRFESVLATPVPPATAEGIRRYLASGRVRGIGPRLAGRLVDRFGDATLEVLESSPERVLEVPGVGRSKAAAIRRIFGEAREQRRALVFLQGLGLGPSLAAEVWRQLGEACVARVTADPYALADTVAGIGFLTADRIARALGTAADDPTRLRAALRHVLRAAVEQGHTALPADDLPSRAAELLAQPVAALESALGDAAGRGELVRVRAGAGALVYLPVLLAAEEEVAARLLALAEGPEDPRLEPRRLDAADGASDPRFSDEQEEAVRRLLGSKVCLLTGGPGVGKTTVMRAVAAAFRRLGLRVALASPTGRAAKQLAAASGCDAQTLHRLFGLRPGTGAADRRDPLDAEVLIIDEASMLDLPLLLRVLRRLPPALRLILVGDPDQLPSVGPGNVLRDLIRSGRFPIARLTRIYRQDRHGLIVENAHRILRGENPLSADARAPGDFYVMHRPDARAGAALVRELFLERIPRRFGFDPRTDIQVLSPMHRGPCGVDALNASLQAGLAGEGEGLPHRGRVFREGDRVMQVRNDHDRGVMNGDLGTVAAVGGDRDAVQVAFDTGTVRYLADQLDDLELAFAITVHKSQGGEFPAVVLPLFRDHAIMLRRSILYTAVTRARELLVVVTDRDAVELAVRDARRPRRHGALEDRLAGRPVERDLPAPARGPSELR